MKSGDSVTGFFFDSSSEESRGFKEEGRMFWRMESSLLFSSVSVSVSESLFLTCGVESAATEVINDDLRVLECTRKQSCLINSCLFCFILRLLVLACGDDSLGA